MRLFFWISVLAAAHVEGRGTPDAPCTAAEIKCTSGECLPRHLWCDGRTDCHDGDDEAGCGLSSQLKRRRRSTELQQCNQSIDILNRTLTKKNNDLQIKYNNSKQIVQNACKGCNDVLDNLKKEAEEFQIKSQTYCTQLLKDLKRKEDERPKLKASETYNAGSDKFNTTLEQVDQIQTKEEAKLTQTSSDTHLKEKVESEIGKANETEPANEIIDKCAMDKKEMKEKMEESCPIQKNDCVPIPAPPNRDSTNENENKLKIELESCNKTMSQHKAYIKELEKKLDAEKETWKELETNYRVLENELITKKEVNTISNEEEVEALKKKIINLESVGVSKEKRIAELLAKSDLRSNSDGRPTTNEPKCTTLEEELKSQELLLIKTKSEHKIKEEQSERKIEEIKALQKLDIENLKIHAQTIETLKIELKESKDKIENLKIHTKTMDTLKTELKESKDKIDNIQKNNLNQCKSIKNAYIIQIEELMAEGEKLRLYKDEEESKYRIYDAELKRLRQDNAYIQSNNVKIDELKKALATKEQEMAAGCLKKQSDEFHEQYETMAIKLKESQDSLLMMKGEYLNATEYLSQFLKFYQMYRVQKIKYNKCKYSG